MTPVTTDATTYLLDVNTLAALTLPDHVHHMVARAWLNDLAPGDTWATTPLTESALVRLLLNPVITGQEVEAWQALDVVSQLRSQPDHRFLEDDTRLTEPHVRLDGLAGPRQVTDFHLVDLAARHGAVLATLDRRIASWLDPADRRHVHTLTGN